MTESLRVVIIDDEPDIRLMLRLSLTRLGVDIVGEAGNGREGLAVVAETGPDAVVLDLLMPVANGFETIPVLQSEHAGIGIVAYTAVAGEFVRNEMRRLGVPIELKQSDVEPLVRRLRATAAASRQPHDGPTADRQSERRPPIADVRPP